jgi:DNA-binding CsgD family transcriptional regulator
MHTQVICKQSIRTSQESDDSAEFRIGRFKYVLCPVFTQTKPPDGVARTTPDRKIVGKIKVGNKQYLIARQTHDRPVSSNMAMPDAMSNILTRRELQIVMLVAEGKVNKQIADLLKISEWTVSTHLRRIFVKLGVDSRAAMIYRCCNCHQSFRNIDF